MTTPSAQPPDKPQYDPQPVLFMSASAAIACLCVSARRQADPLIRTSSLLTRHSYLVVREIRFRRNALSGDFATNRHESCGLGDDRTRRRTAPQPSDDLDPVAGIGGVSDAAILTYMQRRSGLFSHSCLRSVGPRRCCRCGGLRREGAGKSCVRLASPAAPSLAAPLAPCTVLKPVLQFFGLA